MMYGVHVDSPAYTIFNLGPSVETCTALSYPRFSVSSDFAHKLIRARRRGIKKTQEEGWEGGHLAFLQHLSPRYQYGTVLFCLLLINQS
jgi:hypothetical protein